MTIGKFMLGTFLVLFCIFAYLVFDGVPVLVALCIFIYPVMLFLAYFIIMLKHYKNNDDDDEDKNGIR